MRVIIVAVVVLLCLAATATAYPKGRGGVAGAGKYPHVPPPPTEQQKKYLKRTNEKFMADKAKEPGVHSLPSGLLFEIIKKSNGQGKSPKADDDCEVLYTGMLKDGTVFISSTDRESPATVNPSNNVIKGWAEALQLMSEGDKWTLYVPHALAYRESGVPQPPKIPPFSAFVFEMELVNVKGPGGRTAVEAQTDLATKTGKKYEEL